MSTEIELTVDNFDELVLNSEKPYLVDFWAAWCGPCTAVAPIVEAIAAEKADVLNVGKLNVDEQMEIAQRYRIISIPTLLLFKDGEIVQTIVGSAGKDELLVQIDPHL
jgi:thioredoxin 1